LAYPRNAPVAQPPSGLGLAPALGLCAINHRLLRVLDRHAVEEGAVHDFAGTGVGLVTGKHGVGFFAFGNHALDRQVIFASEVEIALVMRRHAEYRAGAVIHQHEIGDIDRQLPVWIERMGDGQAGIKTFFLHRFELVSRGTASFAFFGKTCQRAILAGQLLG